MDLISGLPDPPVGGEKYDQDLSRSLTFRENVLITLSSVTPASSVFIILPAIIATVGGASAMALALASVVGITVALAYAELSSAFPITGGEYAFVARTLGKQIGFALFLLTLVSGVLIIGVIASGIGTYLGAIWSPLAGNWVGIVVVLITTVVACFQIRTNAWVTGLFLVIELLAVGVLARTRLYSRHPTRLHPLARSYPQRPRANDHCGVWRDCRSGDHGSLCAQRVRNGRLLLGGDQAG